MGELRGKGVWLLYSENVDLAVELALAIGATHILYKVGDRGMFFLDSARRVYQRVRQEGLIPFAWTAVGCDDPSAEAEVAMKAIRLGYQGVVFDVGERVAGKELGAAALGRRLLEAGVDPEILFYASYPNIWQHLDIPYREMNTFCRGGFMPWCYPSFRRTPRTVIKKWAYGEHRRWAEEWGDMPPLYPVLAAFKDPGGASLLSSQEFLDWAETLAEQSPPFYSIYRAGTTGRELWPILAALGEVGPVPQPATQVAGPAVVEAAPPAEAEPEPESPPPVYHVVTVDDTVWGICDRYDLPREQFWAWNGHLWDERGLPRDDLYLQEGWRVRVG